MNLQLVLNLSLIFLNLILQVDIDWNIIENRICRYKFAFDFLRSVITQSEIFCETTYFWKSFSISHLKINQDQKWHNKQMSTNYLTWRMHTLLETTKAALMNLKNSRFVAKYFCSLSIWQNRIHAISQF